VSGAAGAGPVSGAAGAGPVSRAAGAGPVIQPGSHLVTWRAAPRLHRLALVTVTAVLAAVITRQAGLLLLAGPALAALAVARRGGKPGAVPVSVAVSATRLFEGEELEVTASLEAPVDEAGFRLEPGPGVMLTGGAATQVAVGGGGEACWTLRADGWGRRVPCTVTLRCRMGGLWRSELSLQPGPVDVFPHPPPARASLVPADLLHRIGEHTGRMAGEGIEFAGIRGYLPGDRLRDLNWAVTSRTGRPHSNQRAALRAADLVLMIDAFSEIGPPGQTTLDLAVRGAAGLATAYLRAGDRVGVVALGGVLRWLGPAPGHRQFFRIAELSFGIRFDSAVIPDLGRVPRTALPPRSLVVVFSPLLDQRALRAVADLRQRGVSLIVVDVLRHEPPADPRSPASSLAVRLWRLDRRALRASLAGLGVPVLAWDSQAGLDGTLAPLRGRPLTVVRR
jgi:uncharacterized protein (DUF58 family)